MNPMVTVMYESDQVSIPPWVVDIDSFRRWADEDDFPETGRIWWLKGKVWVDMSYEQLFSHVAVKTEYVRVLGTIAKQGPEGLLLGDGAFLANVPADIAGIPDGLFVSNASFRRGLVRLVRGKQGGYVELEGSPDMVLEVVSRSSVQKDTKVLLEAYWEAGIKEYWLVDARKEPVQFDIYRHTAKGYVPTRKTGGWMKSAVFGKSFRLAQSKNEVGHPEFTLEVR